MSVTTAPAKPMSNQPAVDQENVSATLTVAAPAIREYLQFPPFGPLHLINSLHHLAELAAPTSRA